ncbi:unnamed protein product [Amoebophrya sp. A25]|nr:unnamed protein product [Amoebophrya sp. A25]|eukprot:GSA25T00008227001.1
MSSSTPSAKNTHKNAAAVPMISVVDDAEQASYHAEYRRPMTGVVTSSQVDVVIEDGCRRGINQEDQEQREHGEHEEDPLQEDGRHRSFKVSSTWLDLATGLLVLTFLFASLALLTSLGLVSWHREKEDWRYQRARHWLLIETCLCAALATFTAALSRGCALAAKPGPFLPGRFSLLLSLVLVSVFEAAGYVGFFILVSYVKPENYFVGGFAGLEVLHWILVIYLVAALFFALFRVAISLQALYGCKPSEVDAEGFAFGSFGGGNNSGARSSEEHEERTRTTFMGTTTAAPRRSSSDLEVVYDVASVQQVQAEELTERALRRVTFAEEEAVKVAVKDGQGHGDGDKKDDKGKGNNKAPQV